MLTRHYGLFFVQQQWSFVTPEESTPAYRLLWDTISAVNVTSRIIQAMHNRRTRTFAGSYKIALWVDLLQRSCVYVYLFPSIVGRYSLGEGLDPMDVVSMGVLVYRLFQAVTLPSVPQDELDEDEE